MFPASIAVLVRATRVSAPTMPVAGAVFRPGASVVIVRKRTTAWTRRRRGRSSWHDGGWLGALEGAAIELDAKTQRALAGGVGERVRAGRAQAGGGLVLLREAPEGRALVPLQGDAKPTSFVPPVPPALARPPQRLSPSCNWRARHRLAAQSASLLDCFICTRMLACRFSVTRPPPRARPCCVADVPGRLPPLCISSTWAPLVLRAP